MTDAANTDPGNTDPGNTDPGNTDPEDGATRGGPGEGEESFADRMDRALLDLWSGNADAMERVVAEVADDDHESGVIASMETTGLIHRGAVPSIPGYEIRAILGRGGMGVVYRAVQKSPRRTVAIKVLRAGATAGPRELALFRREIAALARLRHPGIATIYETGDTADGMPWFSMECIAGSSMIRHARSMETLGERLGLFVQVCEAVQFAHEQGVIHRDLKPSNVAVGGDGRAKILDFGLARLMEMDDEVDDGVGGPRTRTGVMLGTAPYMSPEQVLGLAGDVDERTDVHALGILLAELLTGELPYRVDRARAFESARVVLEDAPRRPSSFDRRIPRDLDAVVLKAIEKAPEDRYPTVAHITQDLRRFLAGQPVRARRPTPWYRLRKWAARRKAVAAAALVATVAVMFGSAALVFGIDSANDAKASTARAYIDLDALRDLVRGFLVGEDPRRGAPADRTMREILIDIAERMDKEFSSSPEVGALIRSDVGAALHGFGQLAEAEVQLRGARSVLQSLRGPDDPELARTTRNLGHLLHAMSRLDEAEVLLLEALRAQRVSLGNDHEEAYTTRNDLGWLMQALGRPERAEARFRENADRARAQANISPSERSYHVGALGHYLLQAGGCDDEARALFQEAIAIADDGGVSVHQTAAIRVHAALAVAREKEYERAISDLDATIGELERTKLGEGLVAAEAWAARGQISARAGDLKEAQRALRESIRRSMQCAGHNAPLTLCRRSVLARALLADGQDDEAARILKVVLETEARERGADTLEYAKHLLTAARIDFAREGLEAALARLARAEEVVARTVGSGHPVAFEVQMLAGSFAREARAWETAADHFARAAACAEAGGESRLRDVSKAHYLGGLCWIELNGLDRAASSLQAAVDALDQWPGDAALEKAQVALARLRTGM